MSRITPIILIGICAVTLRASAQGGSTSQLSEEDRNLLAVVFARFKPDTPAVLLDTTARTCETQVVGCIRQSALDRIPSNAWTVADGAALRAAFVERNARPLDLTGLDVGIRKVSGEEIHAMALKVGVGVWREVWAKFPNTRGIVQVSAPGYTSDRQHALVYIESLCPGRCGSGVVLLLKRDQDNWRIEKSMVSWIG